MKTEAQYRLNSSSCRNLQHSTWVLTLVRHFIENYACEGHMTRQRSIVRFVGASWAEERMKARLDPHVSKEDKVNTEKRNSQLSEI